MKSNIINKYQSSFFIYSAIFLAISLSTSCTKFIDVDTPITDISSKNVYNNDATAISAVTGIYAIISKSNILSDEIIGISALSGLLSDELILHESISHDRLQAYFQNDLQSIISQNNIWKNSYSNLYTINAALENLPNSDGLSLNVKKQLIGESKFLRAFYYFYLVNIFSDVPLVLTTNYVVNETLSRTPKTEVYKQIIRDLLDAKDLLSEDFLGSNLKSSTSERIRPTKWVATALLARVYLYLQDWENAEKEATNLLDQENLFNLENVDNVYKKHSKEAIWQLQPVNLGRNTEEAWTFVIPVTGFNGSHPLYLSHNLIESFETNDKRNINWIKNYTDATVSPNINYYYPFKYKSATLNDPVTEYSIVFRLAEQYLIRAEARTHLGNLFGAKLDLDKIRQRAGLNATEAKTDTELLKAILHERQVELFTEWGHRWLDLKRTGQINTVMEKVTPEKGGIWNSNWQYYPIPSIDILSNPNLVQNPGYN